MGERPSVIRMSERGYKKVKWHKKKEHGKSTAMFLLS